MNFDAKHDEGKLRISLVPTQIIRDIAEVREYGNKKYGDPNNWKTVEVERYVDALLRHTLAFIDDPDSVDEESGIPHYKHMACNMAFICDMKAVRVELPKEPYTMEDFLMQEAERLCVTIEMTEDEDGILVEMTANNLLKSPKYISMRLPYWVDKTEQAQRIYSALVDNFGGAG